MANLQDYLNEITKTTRTPLVRLTLLRSEDETPLKEIISDLKLSGSLNIANRNGSRRGFSLDLDNTKFAYFPSLESNIWLGTKVKLELGLKINNEDFYIEQGVFGLSNPTVNSGSVKLNGTDKYAFLSGEIAGILDSDVIIPNGGTLGNAVRSLMTLSNDPNAPIIEVSLDSEILPYDIIHESGASIGDILEEIANAFSANLYYNANGYLVFEPDTPDSTKGSIWDFDADLETETNYQDGSSTYDFESVKNSVLVIGDNVNGLTVRSKVTNNDLLSDVSVPNIGYEKLEVVKDSIISTVNFAEQRAIYELKRLTSLITQSRLSSMSIFHLDADRIITISDSRLNFTKKRVLLDSISIPFNNTSSMSLTVVDTFDINL